VTPAPADNAARGPNVPAAGSESALLARVEREPVAATAAELDDAFAGLAAFLLDFRTAAQRGGRAPPMDGESRPDGARREDLPPPLHETAA